MNEAGDNNDPKNKTYRTIRLDRQADRCESVKQMICVDRVMEAAEAQSGIIGFHRRLWLN